MSLFHISTGMCDGGDGVPARGAPALDWTLRRVWSKIPVSRLSIFTAWLLHDVILQVIYVHVMYVFDIMIFMYYIFNIFIVW